MMTRRAALIGSAAMTTNPIMQAAAETAPSGPVRHEFVIRDFVTESGTVLPEARIVYGTQGTLNAARDNALLLPSHYMADMHGL